MRRVPPDILQSAAESFAEETAVSPLASPLSEEGRLRQQLEDSRFDDDKT